MNIVAIIQARTNSTRFPNKVFANLVGKPLIWHVVNRLSFCKKIDNIVLATTTNPKDDDLEFWALDNHVNYFRGSEENVLSRYYYAAVKSNADVIVRITADDPFKDPVIIDKVISMVINDSLDFGFNNSPATFPEGLDVEVFTFESLERAFNQSRSEYEQEHVTQFMYRNSSMFKMKNFTHKSDLSHFRWTIDTAADFEMVKRVYESLYKEERVFCYEDILSLLDQYPEISLINQGVERSDMYKKK